MNTNIEKFDWVKQEFSKIFHKIYLFENFYKDFLLEELKFYLNRKLNKELDSIQKFYYIKEELPFEDEILVKAFKEVGEKSYFDLFLRLKIDDNIEEIEQIINSCKALFKKVREIEEDNEDKYEQYNNLFEFIGPYLQNQLKKRALLIPEEDFNDYLDFYDDRTNYNCELDINEVEDYEPSKVKVDSSSNYSWEMEDCLDHIIDLDKDNSAA